MIVGYRDKRTRAFAAGKRVKAFSGIERSAQMELDRLEAAVSLKDASRPARQPFRGADRGPEGPVQHSHQRPMTDLFRVAGRFGRAGQR